LPARRAICPPPHPARSRRDNDRTRERACARSRRANTLDTEWEAFDAAVEKILNEEWPLSVRGVLYRLTTREVYADLTTLHRGELLNKTDSERDVQERIAKLREWGVISYEKIIDGTRGVIERASWANVPEALLSLAEPYERSIWADQKHQVYLLTEKEALTQIIAQITDQYQVPLLPCKGFNSASSFYHDVVKRVALEQRSVVILQFTDLDKPGYDMCDKAETFIRREVRRLCRAEKLRVPRMTFKRIGLTRAQAVRYHLTFRPSKPAHDKPELPNYVAEVVEVDALRAEQIQQIVREAIVDHLDMDTYQRTRDQERDDRRKLRRVAQEFAEDEDE
jgi:hypothetical protein